MNLRSQPEPDPRLVAAVAEMLRGRAGFRHDASLRGRLGGCLVAAAARAGAAVDAFVASAALDEEAMQLLIDEITVQESAFFRDGAQFDTLAQSVLPRLPAGVVWSMACGNGEEAWTLAMVLAETGRDDCRILATDISTTALAHAERGWFRDSQLRGVSPERRQRYFRPAAGGFEVDHELRRLVTFERHNLVDERLPIEAGTCRVAFCRNVLIYLTDEDTVAVLDRLARSLGTGGLLFLGYAESLWRLPTRFGLRRLGEVFVYEVDGAPARRRPSTAAPARDTTKRRRHTPSAPRIERAPAPTSVDRFVAEGAAATAAGDLDGAVVAFRKAAYLDPADPVAALHLAFTLDAVGDADAARQWFRRAHAGVVASAAAMETFDGWSPTEVVRLLERRLETPAPER